ncbi:MAG: DNA polymerase III subunit delta [Armatimonadetes bacterium]|nr:DNA polymerase III subunit delta [Armatimonadota bacterium]
MRSNARGESSFDSVRRAAMDLLAELDRGEVKPVYLFCGADDFQREQVMRRVLSKLVPAEFRDTSLTSFDGDDVTAQRVASELEATGFRFDDAPRRVVLVRDAPYFDKGKTDDAEILVKRLESGLMDDVCLVLESRGAVDRQRRLSKAIAARGKILEFPALANEGDADKLLRGRLGRAGKFMSRSTVQALVERCGLDAQRLTNEVEKLIAYVGEREEIDVDDVRHMVAATAELSVFDLVDAVGRREARHALDQLERLLGQGADPFMILAMLIRQVRLLLQGRWLLDANLVQARLLRMRPYEFNGAITAGGSESMLAQWKERSAGVLPTSGKQALLTQHYFPLQKSLELANRFALVDLEAALERLLQADLGLKSTHLTPEHEIELAVVDLCTRPWAGATIALDALLQT